MLKIIEKDEPIPSLLSISNWARCSIISPCWTWLDICNACDDTTTTLGKLVCTNCGCVLDWKVALQNQECPIGKW